MNKQWKPFLLLVCSLFAWYTPYCQDEKDSLLGVWLDQTEDDSNRVAALHLVTFRYFMYSNPDTARLLARNEAEFARSMGDPIWLGRAFNSIAISYNLQNQIDSAEYYLLKTIDVFESDSAGADLMYAYGNLGDLNRLKGEFKASLQYNEKAIKMARSLGDLESIAKLLGNTGAVYWAQGNNGRAMQYLSEALSIGEKIDEVRVTSSAYLGIGNINGEMGHNEEAIAAFSKSLEAAEKEGLKQMMIHPLNNIGEIYFRMGDMENARRYYRRSLEMSEELQLPSQKSLSMVAISSVYRELGEVNKARDMLEEAIELSQSSGDRLNFLNAKNRMAELQMEIGSYSKAIQHARVGLEAAQEMGVAVGIRDASIVLYHANKALGRSEEALAMLELSQVMADSIQSDENEKQILQERYKYQYEKRALADSLAQNEERLKLELAHQEELNSETRTRNYLIGAGGLLLILAGGGWSRAQFARKKNAQLKEARNKAEESERFKQRFLANMSHEIRTPMNAVLGMTDLTLDTELTTKQKNYLEAIKHSSENLLVIVNDILDLSKLEQGELVIEKIPFRLKDQVELVFKTLQFKAEEKGLHFAVEVDESIPHRVIGDPSRLMQVLMNLTANAIKFTEKGEVKMRVSKGDAKRIRFSIEDTGIGIGVDKVDSIFESFKQADESTSRKYGGTGLGLAICKDLVELQGGRIKVESKLYKGSTFSFDLELPEAEVEVQAAAALTSESLKGVRVLVAEDNRYNQIVVQDTLENLIPEVQITIAGDGEKVLKALEVDQFDVILMDAHMPIMDGVEATKKIRSSNNPIPIIALTASVLNEEIQNCLDAGMDDALPKPFKREELISVLGKFYPNNA